MLRARDLGRFVNGKVVVENAQFEVQGGEVLAVVGPRGSGKRGRCSAYRIGLMNLPAARPTGKEPIIARSLRVICGEKWGGLRRERFCFRERWSPICVLVQRRAATSLSEESLGQLLDEVGLEGYAKREMANLSVGEAQRVSVVRTLANSPLALLRDEPTSALDTASKQAIEFLISKIVRDHKLTCAWVTHDMTQGLRLAQHAFLLESGRIKRMGPANEVLHA
jgi:ABC-type cobalamin/Fe3+-siderophores transport system ATPase subunit